MKYPRGSTKNSISQSYILSLSFERSIPYSQNNYRRAIFDRAAHNSTFSIIKFSLGAAANPGKSFPRINIVPGTRDTNLQKSARARGRGNILGSRILGGSLPFPFPSSSFSPPPFTLHSAPPRWKRTPRRSFDSCRADSSRYAGREERERRGERQEREKTGDLIWQS